MEPTTVTAGAPVLPLAVSFGLNGDDELDRTAFSALRPDIRERFGVSDAGALLLVAVTTIAVILVAARSASSPTVRAASRSLRSEWRSGGCFWSVGTGLAFSIAFLTVMRIGAGGRTAVVTPTHSSLRPRAGALYSPCPFRRRTPSGLLRSMHRQQPQHLARAGRHGRSVAVAQRGCGRGDGDHGRPQRGALTRALDDVRRMLSWRRVSVSDSSYDALVGLSDAAWLRRRIEGGASAAQLGDELGVTARDVRNALRGYDIPLPREQRVAGVDWTTLERDRRKGYAVRTIARLYGLTEDQVVYRMLDIKRKTQRHSNSR